MARFVGSVEPGVALFQHQCVPDLIAEAVALRSLIRPIVHVVSFSHRSVCSMNGHVYWYSNSTVAFVSRLETARTQQAEKPVGKLWVTGLAAGQLKLL